MNITLIKQITDIVPNSRIFMSLRNTDFTIDFETSSLKRFQWIHSYI